MDIEPGNYILPRDETVPMTTVPLDGILGDLRGGLNRFDKLSEAKKRVMGHIANQ